MNFFNIIGNFLLISWNFTYNIVNIKEIKEINMYGYKIRINGLPELIWACETTLDNYEWKNRNSKDMLEISYSKFDTMSVMINNNNYLLKNSALTLIMADEKYTASCEFEKPITIVSVAVKLSDFKYQACEITKKDFYDKTALILPAFLNELPINYEIELIKALHKIIKLSSSKSENQKIAMTSTFFKLIYEIDKMTRNQFYSKNNKSDYYIKKIDYIINSKYNKKVTLQSVASELNISPIYLSSMYKNITGIKFSDQLLNVRMYHAEKLLIDQNIPTAKVAELCGFCDESYFRKKFKLFFGTNVKEYRQIKNGLTLYHEKPERKNVGR